MTEVTGALPGSLNNYFAVESELLTTRTASGFKARDKSKGEPVFLWMFRYPLSQEGRDLYLSRMESLGAISGGAPTILAYGVDSSGFAFASLPLLDGQGILSGHIDRVEAERRFLGSLRAVDVLHTSGLSCEDISAASFWVERTGNVRLIGVMGNFENYFAVPVPPERDQDPYRAPDAGMAGSPDQTMDTFSLGVLGYVLFSKRIPDPANLVPLSALGIGAPVWADQLFAMSLSSAHSSRLENAGVMLKMIQEIRDRALSGESVPARVEFGITPRREGAQSLTLGKSITSASASNGSSGDTVKQEIEAKKAKSIRIGIFGGLFIAIAIVGVFFNPFKSSQEDPFSRELAAHRDAATSPELKRAIEGISAADAGDLREKEVYFQRVAASNDPLAHDVLVRGALDAKSPEIRALAEQALLERARRLNLTRASEQVRRWFREIAGQPLPAAYEPLLRALDITLPQSARDASLKQAYTSSPREALRLAAALSFDVPETAKSSDVLTQLIGDSLRLEDSSKRAVLSLVLAHPELSQEFGEDVISHRTEIPDSELPWLIDKLSERADINIRPIAAQALERHSFPANRERFLILLRDRPELSPSIMRTLARASLGQIDVDDIRILGAWLDVDAERILLSMLGELTDKALLLEAFDTLAGKSLTLEPSKSVIAVVRSKYWNRREELARFVGAIGNPGGYSEAALKQEFDALKGFLKDKQFIDALLDANIPAVSKVLVQTYPEVIGVGRALGLLENSDKDVRIAAIVLLKDINDVGAMKLIIDRYSAEQDPQVKGLFRETFWFLKNRE